jgi:uncharacterized protein (UPF0276 family)
MAAHRPWAGVSLMPEDDFLRAAHPLFAAGEVEVLEWSFDTGWPPAVVPRWALDLIAAFGANNRLLGHGVHYSALSAGTESRQQAWLANCAEEVRRHPYRHVSEHFGFSGTRGFHQSAPLPVPLNETTLSLGRDRLRRLAEVAKVPVGLENLAFAFCPRDVEEQGRFLAALLEPVDGFLLLDLHNLYCQAVNFGRTLDELLATYPLGRVRELHVSGGSWSAASDSQQPIRRDTHDGPVPAELFEWLPRVLAVCPPVEAVILERLGGTFSVADDEPFRRDFRRLKEIVRAS